ncbi:DUF1120 domain-containing protein (plasmid) [Enterobacter sp. D2]|uniref:DUF1120 domain-containing protein n=1 Tax=Enterobacter sp. D2 TaxID=3102784 RepID=UPI002ACAD767|nr:DUF1120 domain-containing protein [Enterobacter sp. D2]MDZ5731138.1 DUF1120 domain-containing protein [Enterobacter sp. D2]
MKNSTINKFLLASTLSLCVSSAFASTAVMQVKGKLMTSSCTPTLSNGGLVNYGNFKVGDLDTSNPNQLGEKDITLTINCSAPTRVAITITDDRQSSANDSVILLTPVSGADSVNDEFTRFGLGKTQGGVNIGAWAPFVNKATVLADGASANLIYDEASTGSTWAPLELELNDYQVLPTNAMVTLGDSNNIPKAFTSATFPMKTSAVIDDTTTLALTDDTNLDGQATISLVYL